MGAPSTKAVAPPLAGRCGSDERVGSEAVE